MSQPDLTIESVKTDGLKIEYVGLDELEEYEQNAKQHPLEQIEQIVNSIERFGFRDPIGIWHGVIVEGHGRYRAALRMGLKRVPVIRLDDMGEDERRAYMLAHNQLTMNTGWDMDKLEHELGALGELEFGMEDFGFGAGSDFDGRDDGVNGDEDEEDDDTYTSVVNIPQYEPTGKQVTLKDLVDDVKVQELLEDIDDADVPEDVKAFLRVAACRHYVFNYTNIAEYYATAPTSVQELMEKSALVLIDVDDAIANGYVVLSKKLHDLFLE